jgi:hypothetical protein
LLDELGDKHVDEITAPTVRAFMAVLGKRASQSRGSVNSLRTLLTGAVETGAVDHRSLGAIENPARCPSIVG